MNDNFSNTSSGNGSTNNGPNGALPNARAARMMGAPDPRLAWAGAGGGGFSTPAGEGAVVLHRGDENLGDRSMQQLFAMIARRRMIFLLVMGLALAATIAYLMLTPPIYGASATLQVQASDTSANGDKPSDSSLVMSAPTAIERSLQTQLTIIQSDQVRKGAMRRVPPELREKLNEYSEVNIEAVSTTNLIAIKVLSHDREASTRLANAYCDEYIQLSRAENRGELQQALDYVSTQKEKVGKKLDAARMQLQHYKEQHNVFDIKSEAGAVVSAARSAQQQLEKARADRYVNQAELSTVSGMIPTMPKIKIMPGGIAMRPEIMTMRNKIEDLKLERMERLRKYRADRPEIKTIDEQIAAIQDAMKNQTRTEVNTWSQQENPIRSGLQNRLVDLEVKNYSLQAEEAALGQAVAQANAQLTTLPTREREMSIMELNEGSLEKQYGALSARQTALQMAQEARMANASPLFVAEPPKAPLSRAPKLLASALLVGLLLALALSALIDWLDDGVYNETDAKMVSQLPVLAQIPQVSRDAQRSLLEGADTSVSDPKLAHLRENFRMLRTMIALSSPAYQALPAGDGAHNGNGSTPNGSTPNGGANGGLGVLQNGSTFGGSSIRSVVITSSLPNEGKSVSTTNLAIAAALSGERVILVDCDLRHPGLHFFFDLPNDIGVASVASGACTLDEALQNTRIPTLRVLTTGPVNAEPLQVLNSPAARAMFDQLSAEADFVVIDTPPALVFAEAQVIAAMTDALLLVISSQDAKKREVARTRELFDQSGLFPLGAILNKLPPGPESYYYAQYGYQDKSRAVRA